MLLLLARKLLEEGKGLLSWRPPSTKKFGPKARINFTPGPEMNVMAARAIAEVKVGRTSTDFYLGSQSHLACSIRKRL